MTGFGKRRKAKRRGTRLFFATDIHGSERCFRKWMNAAAHYDVDALVLGGDVTGKTFVAVVEDGSGHYSATLHGKCVDADEGSELAELKRRIADVGHYPLVVTPSRLIELEADAVAREIAMHEPMVEQLERWVALADARLEVPAYAILGNDDAADLADIFRRSQSIAFGEDGLLELPGGYTMASLGHSTPTPWNTPRELSESELATRIDAVVADIPDPTRAIWNFHCPPRDTHLDSAPRLDEDLRPVVGANGAETASVGSQAIREAVLTRQPLLTLHGHVHESAAAQRLGETLCINPGSDYGQGILRGAIVEIDDAEGVSTWQLIQG